MNQHVIQEAWLKQFASKRGRVAAMSCLTGKVRLHSPKSLASLPDLQSIGNEISDGVIETQGIEALYALARDRISLTEKSRTSLNRWVALHMARSFRSREGLEDHNLTYDAARMPYFDQDLAHVESYSEVWCLQTKETDEPMILADNPIVQFLDNEALVFPFSPRLLIVIGAGDPVNHTFAGRTWPQVMNEMSYANAEDRVFGNPDLGVPWDKVRERGKDIGIVKREKPVKVRRDGRGGGTLVS